MPGVLEEMAEEIRLLRESVTRLAELVQLSSPAAVPSDSLWGGGAMDLASAARFSGISRNELYNLMRSGELPFAVATRERLVPHRWLVQYLERKQLEVAQAVQ